MPSRCLPQKNKRTTISNDTLIIILDRNSNCFHLFYFCAIAACAAARRAIGTRNGEQDT